MWRNQIRQCKPAIRTHSGQIVRVHPGQLIYAVSPQTSPVGIAAPLCQGNLEYLVILARARLPPLRVFRHTFTPVDSLKVAQGPAFRR
jgi:hypothetical protein